MITREALLEQMRKKYKREILRQTKKVKSFSSGILELDVASGIGGHKCGGVVEIYGAESTGKSLIALRAIATAQKKYNLPSVLFDTEFGTPPDWMATQGVDLGMIELPDFSHGEEIFDMALDFIKSGIYAYVVVDSLVGAVPEAVLGGSVSDRDVGVEARMIGKALKQITLELSKVDTNLMIVNQVRVKIPQGGYSIGNLETTPGGNALKFYSTQRIRTSKKPQSEFRRNGEVVGHTVVAVYKKNKSAPPLRKAEFRLDFFQGVDNSTALFHRGVELGLVTQKGNTYEYQGTTFSGSKKFLLALSEDPILADTLWSDILNKACSFSRDISISANTTQDFSEEPPALEEEYE